MKNELSLSKTESTWLRVQLILILAITVSIGLIFGYILLILGLESLVIRNAVVIPIIYLVFFGCVALWRKIFKVTIHYQDKSRFTSSTFKKMESKKDKSEFSFIPGSNSVGELIVCILYLIIFAVIMWVIIEAPAIMCEAIFDIALFTTLAASIRKHHDSLWYVRLFRKTVFAFLIFYFATVILLLFIHQAYPDQSTLAGVIHKIVF